ncbi:hypothetical protein BJ322DRAFT_1007439 [Thelephora terrestris]|uniref:Uncharacterized protein n=1 Tax=Thelephora terrestris TaxID=56493 RepID=A0A9P6HCN8_9AGAM|nr:hypothetical protein BJ322DRAFT_1007439 [Thelephora terrestris]
MGPSPGNILHLCNLVLTDRPPITARGSSGHHLFISALKTEREMCSYLEWQLNIEPSVLKDFDSRDFKGPGPNPSQYTLPTPSSGPFAHPKPSTKNNPTAIPSFGPGAPPSPPLTTSLTP